jgi:hypothetical protein
MAAHANLPEMVPHQAVANSELATVVQIIWGSASASCLQARTLIVLEVRKLDAKSFFTLVVILCLWAAPQLGAAQYGPLSLNDILTSRPATEEQLDRLRAALLSHERAQANMFIRITVECSRADGKTSRIETRIRQTNPFLSVAETVEFAGDKVLRDEVFFASSKRNYSFNRLLLTGFIDDDDSSHPNVENPLLYVHPIGKQKDEFSKYLQLSEHRKTFRQSITKPNYFFVASYSIVWVFDESNNYFPVFQGIYLDGNWQAGRPWLTTEAENFSEVSDGTWWPTLFRYHQWTRNNVEGASSTPKIVCTYQTAAVDFSPIQSNVESSIKKLLPPPGTQFVDRATGENTEFRNVGP